MHNEAPLISTKNEEIPRRILKDDLYLIELFSGLSVISRRASSQRLTIGSSLSDIIDVEARSELRRYLSSPSDRYLLLPTLEGTALISSAIFPSSRLLTLSFINSERGCELFGIPSVRENDSLLLPYPPSDAAPLISAKHRRELEGDLGDVMDITRKALKKRRIYSIFSYERVSRCLMDIVNSIAELVMCPINLSLTGDFEPDDRFDEDLFKGFLISVFSLCREMAKYREAKVTLSTCRDGICVEISFIPLRKIELLETPEVTFFESYADRQRMIFEYSSTEDEFRVKFCPSRKDWSRLGLKSDIGFDWNA